MSDEVRITSARNGISCIAMEMNLHPALRDAYSSFQDLQNNRRVLEMLTIATRYLGIEKRELEDESEENLEDAYASGYQLALANYVDQLEEAERHFNGYLNEMKAPPRLKKIMDNLSFIIKAMKVEKV